ncbi:MAG: methyltransferase domain-containing protein [Alphaproteobacteria bacterium]|nr:MAG: methyltransferase domain-containing protein [Alphaproteobacteria bacterium]
MRPDVIALRNFYRRPLGRSVADIVSGKVRCLWPSLKGCHVAGIGFATPVLGRLDDGAASRIALMPAAQGVLHWPRAERNATALVEEQALPVPDGAFDRVLLVHALELADHAPGLLEETWRILSPGGRVIIVVPRRRAIWSGAEQTPFGSGQPYSRHQIREALAGHSLPVTRILGALYLPPVAMLATPKTLRLAERLASPFLGGLAGVLVVEAEKQIYRPVSAARRLVPRPATALPAGPRVAPPLVPMSPSSDT